MTEKVKESSVKNDTEKKKGVFGKVKDALIPDQEEQAAIISTGVRIVVLGWSGAILTLNYVAIPGVPQQKIDPTFIASVFTGVLASFGIATASKKGDGTMKMNGDNNGQVSKKDMEAMIAKASTGGYQTTRVETPLKIEGATIVPDSKPKPIDT